MTSKEILKEIKDNKNKNINQLMVSQARGVWEIALQLALANEKPKTPKPVFKE